MSTFYAFRPICSLCETCDLKPWYCENCEFNLCLKCKVKHLADPDFISHKLLPIAQDIRETQTTDSKHAEVSVTLSTSHLCNGNDHYDTEAFINDNAVSINRHKGEQDIKHDSVTVTDLQRHLSDTILPSAFLKLESIEKEFEKLHLNKREYREHANSIQTEVRNKKACIISTLDRTAQRLLTELDLQSKSDLGILEKQESILLEQKCDLEDLVFQSQKQNCISESKGLIRSSALSRWKILLAGSKSCSQTVEMPVIKGSVSINDTEISKMFGHIAKKNLNDQTQTQKVTADNDLDLHIDYVANINLADNDAAYCIRTLSDRRAWIGTGKQSVRLIDVHGNAEREHFLDFYPYNITVARNGDILLPKGSSIKILTTEGNLSTFYNADPYFVQGVCTSCSGDIYVCLTQRTNGKIIKLNPNAVVAKTIEFDHKGNPIFINPTKIAENPVTNDICVEDSRKSNIIVVSQNGDLQFTYNGNRNDSFSPFYVTCDSNGYILIGDNSHFRIHLLNKDGNFIQYILTQEDGLFSPWGMDIGSDLLWVGTLSGKVWLVKYTIKEALNSH